MVDQNIATIEACSEASSLRVEKLQPLVYVVDLYESGEALHRLEANNVAVVADKQR
jgi:hypothetical protein